MRNYNRKKKVRVGNCVDINVMGILCYASILSVKKRWEKKIYIYLHTVSLKIR